MLLLSALLSRAHVPAKLLAVSVVGDERDGTDDSIRELSFIFWINKR